MTLCKIFITKVKKIEKIDNCLSVNKGRKIPSNKTIKDLEKLQLKKNFINCNSNLKRKKKIIF